jgi:hypothetical protein
LFRVKKNGEFRKKFVDDFEDSVREFSLNDDELSALRERDYQKLFELGLKHELILYLAEISKQKA